MTVSKDEVVHTAKLAKLKLTNEQADLYTNQLNDILTSFEELEKINTDHVKPTNQVGDRMNIFREDIVKEYPADKKQKLLREAPEINSNYIVVPKTV